LRDGFSLIEVVIVIAILAVTAAMAAPAFVSRTTDEDGAAAGEFAEIVSRARRTALVRSVDVRVVIQASGQWWILEDSSQEVLAGGVVAVGRAPTLERVSHEIRVDRTGTVAGDAAVLISDRTATFMEFHTWNGSVAIERGERIHAR
jgi:prepilin-type N-terminal cleavage/methylation domain-containing protein